VQIILISTDSDLVSQAKLAYEKTDKLTVFSDWAKAFEKSGSCELMIVDLLATLTEPHKIDGYEEFALAKMRHAKAADVPLVLIGAPDDYKIDSMVGWPNFVFGHVRRPVTMKIFRRMSTWV
jgi:hypothetical protein